jgi:hypothetical protein
LRRQLHHISFDLADVLDDPWVGYYVTCGLVIQKVPCGGDTVVCLGKDGTFVNLSDRAILVVFGALDGPVAHVNGFVEERPVLGLVVDWVGCTIPVHCVDKLTYTLIGLLGLAVDSHLVFSGVTLHGVVSISAASSADLLGTVDATVGSTVLREGLLFGGWVAVIR